MRFLSGVAAICTFALYIYRLYTVIHCMSRHPDDFPSHVDRVVWSVLAVIVPLGIGAYLYDLGSRKNPIQLMFLVPFTGVVLSVGYVMLKIWPRSTNFQFDFLGM
ncbi:hypothetical protein [Luteolibacter sp. AS25]|uniref:hypothetical protein n=1 Tax=Luteolibacter sp. AS25 TaxID=3135776 RepID=UPI00398B022E